MSLEEGPRMPFEFSLVRQHQAWLAAFEQNLEGSEGSLIEYTEAILEIKDYLERWTDGYCSGLGQDYLLLAAQTIIAKIELKMIGLASASAAEQARLDTKFQSCKRALDIVWALGDRGRIDKVIDTYSRSVWLDRLREALVTQKGLWTAVADHEEKKKAAQERKAAKEAEEAAAAAAAAQAAIDDGEGDSGRAMPRRPSEQ